MSGEQEHVLNARFLPRLQEPLCTTLWRAEKSERIGNLAGLILRYRRRVIGVVEACLGHLDRRRHERHGNRGPNQQRQRAR